MWINCTVVLFQLAQPIRLLLNYVGEEFEDKQYEQGDGNACDLSCSGNIMIKFKHM